MIADGRPDGPPAVHGLEQPVLGVEDLDLAFGDEDADGPVGRGRQ